MSNFYLFYYYWAACWVNQILDGTLLVCVLGKYWAACSVNLACVCAFVCDELCHYFW